MHAVRPAAPVSVVSCRRIPIRKQARNGTWGASSSSTTSRRACSTRTSTTRRSIRSTATCLPTTASSPCRAASATPTERARSRPASATRRRPRCAASASSSSTTPRPTSTAGNGAGPTPASTARPSARSPPCSPRNPLRLGRLREAQQRPEDAADAYERAGAHQDVLRVWRNAGAWERAVELAQGDIRADLDWLIELERLIERRPDQQNRRLRNGERDRLEKLLDTVQKRPPRKRSAKAALGPQWRAIAIQRCPRGRPSREYRRVGGSHAAPSTWAASTS